MSIFSDYKCGALSDDEFKADCIRMNNRERYEEEHIYDEDEEDQEGNE